METVALALGGNLGDVPAEFLSAIQKMKQQGLMNVSVSSCYVTAPVDCRAGAPDFVNGAVTGQWAGSEVELLSLCKKMESEAGRAEEYERNSDRPLDIDIIFFGDKKYLSSSLTIPHKETAARLFVLLPLVEIDPNMLHPVLNKTVTELVALIDNQNEFDQIMAGKRALQSC